MDEDSICYGCHHFIGGEDGCHPSNNCIEGSMNEIWGATEAPCKEVGVMLFEIPCLPGQRVYFLDENIEKEGRKKVCKTFVNSGFIDHITIGDALNPIMTVCDEKNTWIDFGLKEIVSS